MSLDLEEIDTLARTLFGEARGEPLWGLVAVAWVVRNRAAKPGWWGRDIVSVCLAPKQFSCWNPDDPNYGRLMSASRSDSSFLRCFAVATLVLLGELVDPTSGATHYHTIQKPVWAKEWPPYWAAQMVATFEVGAHRFLKEGE